jgi:hypothetical protein
MDEIGFGPTRGYSAPMGLMKIHSKAVLSRRVLMVAPAVLHSRGRPGGLARRALYVSAGPLVLVNRVRINTFALAARFQQYTRTNRWGPWSTNRGCRASL